MLLLLFCTCGLAALSSAQTESSTAFQDIDGNETVDFPTSAPASVPPIAPAPPPSRLPDGNETVDFPTSAPAPVPLLSLPPRLPDGNETIAILQATVRSLHLLDAEDIAHVLDSINALIREFQPDMQFSLTLKSIRKIGSDSQLYYYNPAGKV